MLHFCQIHLIEVQERHGESPLLQQAISPFFLSGYMNLFLLLSSSKGQVSWKKFRRNQMVY